MAINIKDKETDAKARELAKMTNKSITQAISYALDLALSSIKKENAIEEKYKLVSEICNRFKVHMKGRKMTSTDHAEILYDEMGLP